MRYALSWLEHWSTKREAADPRIITLFNEEDDGWYEHERLFYFIAGDDTEAKAKATKFIEGYSDPIEVFSVTNRKTGAVIMTEEA